MRVHALCTLALEILRNNWGISLNGREDMNFVHRLLEFPTLKQESTTFINCMHPHILKDYFQSISICTSEL